MNGLLSRSRLWLKIVPLLVLLVALLPAAAGSAPQPDYQICDIQLVYSPNYGDSILAKRWLTANQHWLTSEELSPNPRPLGYWCYGAISNCGLQNHRAIINMNPGDVVKVCVGASDVTVACDANLYNHPNNRCFACTYSGGSHLSCHEVFNVYGRVTDGGGAPITNVTVSDGAGHTATTNGNGDYSFSYLPSGSYTLTPSKAGYTFNPSSRTISGGPPYLVTGQDFTGGSTPPPPTYSISGRVTNIAGNGVANVTISDGVGHTATTNGNGDYTLSGLPSGSYTIRPNKSDWIFFPGSRSANVPPDAAGKNFSGLYLPPPPSCSVPYFSQIDPRWKDHALLKCTTIGSYGCTLTSATMVFGYYGATHTPDTLSDCMGTSACPFYWGVGERCSQDKADWINKYSFNWATLSDQLNNHKRPVILGMHRYINGVKHTHWIVVLSGSGQDPANYTVHDPGVLNGASMKLNAFSSKWTFDWLAVYSGQPPCQKLAIGEPELPPVAPFLPAVDPAAISPEALVPVAQAEVLPASAVVVGTILPYRMTDMTMTVLLTATSSAGDVVEMMVWTDSMTQTAWQSFQSLVYLPVSEEMYALFRDSAGNVSNMEGNTLFRPYGPPEAPFEILLPLINK